MRGEGTSVTDGDRTCTVDNSVLVVAQRVASRDHNNGVVLA
jgi:hypothetical protein